KRKATDWQWLHFSAWYAFPAGALKIKTHWHIVSYGLASLDHALLPFTAPEVVLELDKLPAAPCRTQCPECRQFITTETFSSVSSVTWLVCIMTALVGCVAGCCLIPFCMDRFKSTNHRCPKCRTLITTIKKL
uniref:LITAF domain-containing protein n=1 Tax=Maylandia zebra TaxID=106582 RepID=A0A3P9D6Z5_9CICH